MIFNNYIFRIHEIDNIKWDQVASVWLDNAWCGLAKAKRWKGGVSLSENETRRLDKKSDRCAL